MTKTALKPASNKGGRPRKHGAYLFLRTGIIPEGKNHLAQMADAAISRIADDLGGLQNLSGSQVMILREIRQMLIFKFIVDEKLMIEGIFKPGPGPLELQGPLSAFYLSCSNSITRNCIALGLKKVSIADDLESYLKRNYGKGKAKDSSAPVIESVKPLTKGTSKRQRAPQTIVDDSGEVNHE